MQFVKRSNFLRVSLLQNFILCETTRRWVKKDENPWSYQTHFHLAMSRSLVFLNSGFPGFDSIECPKRIAFCSKKKNGEKRIFFFVVCYFFSTYAPTYAKARLQICFLIRKESKNKKSLSSLVMTGEHNNVMRWIIMNQIKIWAWTNT